MPGPAEFLYGAVSRDGGQTWTRPVFVPIETICSRMAVAPLDGGGSWNPVDPDADYGGRLHLMLHHDVPGGVGWTYDRRNLALFFRRGDGFEFTAGPGFSGLEPRAVYPQHAIHDGTLLVLYTQSHAEKRSIRYARITPLPDPEKRYLLPRADVVPDRRPSPDRSILRFESLALQHLNARATPDLAAGRVALAAWLRPDCDGILWDNRAAAEDGRASGFAWGLVALGGTGDRAARPVLFLQFTGQRFLSRLAVPQSEWNYAAVEWDGPGRKLRFRVGDQVEELEIPEGVTLDPTGGAGVIGAGRDRQRRGPAFHGDIRYLAVFDHLPGPAAHRALHDRFSAGSGRELPGASLPDTMSPVLELDPADPEALARDFAFPEAGFQGVRWIRLLGHSVMRVTGEGSAGVDLDENHRVRGDTVWLRFRFLPEQGNRLVICTVGDANHPARVQWRDDTVYLVAGEREERIGPAPRGRWTTVEIESAGTWTRASVEGHDPVRVRHVPEGTWVYLGQGYRTGGASVGDVFLVDAGSVESRVARAPEPHRALYNNDGLGGGVMSLRTWGARLGPDAEYADLLRAAVDEMAGLGPHLFAAGDGWVVWWRSREYPIEEHLRWLHEMAYSEERAFHLGRQAEYILDGGDLVQTFVDHCRRVGVPPYISFRMNDYHWSEWLWLPEPLRSRELFGRSHWPLSRISRFLFENWEYRIGPPHAAYQALQTDEERMAFILNPQRRTSLRDRGVLDWAQPAVREHKLAFFRELAGYDLDGIEMDFMRHSRFFKDEHPVEDRIAIMTEFVRDVRRALDEAAPDGRRRRLVARVPSRLVQMPQLGVDLERFVEAGLSDVILSQHFNTTPDSDLARVVRMLPGTPVYLEMTQCSARIDGIWRFVTPEQIATAAHVTYARGGAGLSYFNIQYYRQGGDQSSERGLQCDIPFDTMRRVTDPAAAARLPQHYFVGPGHNIPPAEGARQLPRELLHGSPVEVRIDCAPPAGGWTAGGRLRVEATSAWADRQVTLRVNGVVCEPAEDVSAPLPGPYLQPESEPRPERLRAWAVPPELLVDGENSVRLELESGDGLRIFFVDLGFPK